MVNNLKSKYDWSGFLVNREDIAYTGIFSLHYDSIIILVKEIKK